MAVYGKKEATMTRGLAILCMLVLHLFCRKGEDVYGTPLIWFSESIPLVYYFGFFAEICVGLYSISAGYARCLSGNRENQMPDWRICLQRAGKLLVNYWVVLALFSVLGLVFDPDGAMPGSVGQFVKSIVLLHSYNGAWWYLNTYLLLLLLPTKWLMHPVKKVNALLGLAMCMGFTVVWYLVNRFGLWPTAPFSQGWLNFVWKEIDNLLGVLPMFWAGAYICHGNMVDKAYAALEKHTKKYANIALLALFCGLFVTVCFLEKAVIIPMTAVAVFFIFNLWRKGRITESTFLFLGKHSTNMWLVHMFFYLYILKAWS